MVAEGCVAENYGEMMYKVEASYVRNNPSGFCFAKATSLCTREAV